MRQRRIKNLEEKIESVNANLIEDPTKLKGKWRSAFVTGESRADDSSEGDIAKGDADLYNDEAAKGIITAKGSSADAPLVLELGCGKGQFISGMAGRNPSWNFIGFEGDRSVGYHALKKVDASGCSNARIALGYIHSMEDFFIEDELDGLFLNFSDPWPKKRNEKRRLTCSAKLKEYTKVIKSGGFIEFRTDNDDFFLYSVDRFAEEPGLEVTMLLRDLHAAVILDGLTTTEYEDKFSAQGKKVNFLQAKVL